MFSFPRPGCVQTGTPGYAYVLDAMSGESYIFLRDLAVGSQSKVQLVANIFTQEVVVRKVSKHLPPLNDASSLTKAHEDREVRILDHLNSIILNPVYQPPLGFTPRWTTCLSHETIPVMSGGPRPRMECMRVGYWKLCNAGYLGEWARSWRAGSTSSTGSFGGEHAPFPVRIIARCIAQVCQTLHIMYQAGPEPVYHCDLHNANIFIHFDDPSDPECLPDFYIGDFGCSRTASEARGDGIALYGASTIKDKPTVLLSSSSSGPPPGVVPPHQRRAWDVARFLQGLDRLVDLATPANQEPSGQTADLHRLMKMMQFLDEQEQRLAATNPHSRPASLVQVFREATKLEQTSLAVEKGTEKFRAFTAARKGLAREMVEGEKPFVFTDGEGDARKKRAEKFGRMKLEGGWSLVESV